MKHHFLETNGITLHVVSAGPEDGPLLVLLHGFPEFWFGWQHQIEEFASNGYHVIVPDQRGYNLSDKPAGIADYTLDILRDDITGLIDHFGKSKATIIGHDWGGAVAWHLAATKPHYAERLIAVNIPHPRAMQKVLPRNPLQWLRSSYIAFFQLPEVPEKVFSAGDYAPLSAGMVSSSKTGAFSEDGLVAYREAWSQHGALTGMLNWYRAIRKGSMAKTPAAKIQLPVRIIWGLGDQFLSPSLATESLKFCEGGELVFIGEATHWVHHEQAYIFNKLVIDFIGEEKTGASL